MIIYNVIDRDSDICKVNNHTALLCKDKYTLGVSLGEKSFWLSVMAFYNRPAQYQDLGAFLRLEKIIFLSIPSSLKVVRGKIRFMIKNVVLVNH
jgi:hypothetical protein